MSLISSACKWRTWYQKKILVTIQLLMPKVCIESLDYTYLIIALLKGLNMMMSRDKYGWSIHVSQIGSIHNSTRSIWIVQIQFIWNMMPLFTTTSNVINTWYVSLQCVEAIIARGSRYWLDLLLELIFGTFCTFENIKIWFYYHLNI